MSIHQIPENWIHSRDKLQTEVENQFKTFIANHFDRVDITLAIKGGWKTGYTWNGKYRISVVPSHYGRTTSYNGCIKIGYSDTSIESIRKLLHKAADKFDLVSRKHKLVMYHREMLNDKKASKRHQKLIKAKYPANWTTIPEAIEYAEKLLSNLLRNRGWELEIDGYHAPDGRVFDDLFTYKYYA